MATPQIDKPTESVEELLEKANRAALEKKEIPPAKGLTEDQLQDKGYLRDLALRELVAIIQGNAGNIRGVAACSVLLDRVDGRPQQSVDVTGKIGIIDIVMEAAKLRQSSQMPIIENSSNIND